MLAEKTGASGFQLQSRWGWRATAFCPCWFNMKKAVSQSGSCHGFKVEPGRPYHFGKKAGMSLNQIHYRGNSVPVDKLRRMMIKFRGMEQKYEYVSAADILDGNVSLRRLEGRIVFVFSAVGLKNYWPRLLGRYFQAWKCMRRWSIIFWPVTSLRCQLVQPDGCVAYSCFRGGDECCWSATETPPSVFLAMLFVVGLWFSRRSRFFYRTDFLSATAFPIVALVCIYIFLTVIR